MWIQLSVFVNKLKGVFIELLVIMGFKDINLSRTDYYESPDISEYIIQVISTVSSFYRRSSFSIQ